MKIFLELWTGIGPLIRSLPIANALRQRGHEVTFLAYDQAAQYMIACGFEQADIDPQKIAVRPMVLPSWRNNDAGAGLRGFADIEWLKNTQKEWRRYFNTYKPDLILSDFGVQSAIAARALGIPQATITQSCMHPGRFGGRIQYWNNECESEKSHQTADVINQYLKQFNAAPIESYDDLYTSHKTIIPGFPEFDRLEEQCEKETFYSGPVLWDGLHEKKTCEQPTFKNGNPVIFSYPGRMNDGAGNSGEVLFNAITAAAKANDSFNVIISTGGMDAKAKHLADSVPENVKVVDWLPMDQAFMNCDIVIHHGGHGSCMANFKYGKPALIIPTHTERNYNAHRMQDLETGIIINREDVNTTSILNGIEALLREKKYIDNTRRYQKKIQQHYPDSAESAADYIVS